MIKYHISPRTGEPMKCIAKGKCPFGDLETDHYPSKDEARAAFESKMNAQEFPSFDYGKIKVSALTKELKTSKKSFTVPSGVYVVGDPYYTAGRDDYAWSQWTASSDATPNDEAVGSTYNGYPVLGMRLPMEGVYYDSMGRPYNSSSGFIGLIPVSLTKQMQIDQDDALDDGYLVSFDSPTKIEANNGTLYFGDGLFIRTEPDMEHDEDDMDLYEMDTEHELWSGDEREDWDGEVKDEDEYFFYNYEETEDEPGGNRGKRESTLESDAALFGPDDEVKEEMDISDFLKF